MAAEALPPALSDLRRVLSALQKYEASFSADAKQQLQATTALVSKAEAELGGLMTADGIVGYLIGGSRLMNLRTLVLQLQQAVSNIANGAIPIPRSSKEELSRVHGLVLGVKINVSNEQQLLVTQLRKVCTDLTSQRQDVDVIEAHLDNTVRSVLQQVHGVESLEEQALTAESVALSDGIQQLRAAGAEQDMQMLTLALNSVQRLHASRSMHGEGESLDDSDEPAEAAAEEDDDDDPFFMPMPGAIKWAEASKFKELAAPLAPEQPADKQFMIVVDQDDSSSGSAPATPAPRQDAHGAAQQEMQALSLGGGAAAAAVHASSTSAPSQQGGAKGPEPAAPAGANGHAANGSEAAAPAASGGEAEAAGDAAAATAGTEGPPPEKLNQFVNFLNGENQGACMFHAQMRLSVEGCQRLADFLKSSSRVRALSLSHNYLGDVGLRILCEGLRQNRSVTALDLPDNNVTDLGASMLADAIKDNPSLTQLQLAFNRIGDEGAAALAGYIKTSTSLKKLGLSNNNIGKAGCQALTAAINSNQSLKHLQLLPGNPVEEKDAKALAKALKRNNKFSIKQLLGLKHE